MFIALTGGIAAGKSTALTMFKQLGVQCCDTDIMVHELYRDSKSLREQLSNHWGIDVNLDDNLVRRKVADIVFSDPDQLKWLESIIHPLIIERLSKLRCSTDGLIICAVPLLFEIGLEKNFDKVVSVSCLKEDQHKRLIERGWSEKEIEARLERQFSMDKKESLADYVLSNIGDVEFLKKQCIELIRSWNISSV